MDFAGIVVEEFPSAENLLLVLRLALAHSVVVADVLAVRARCAHHDNTLLLEERETHASLAEGGYASTLRSAPITARNALAFAAGRVP